MVYEVKKSKEIALLFDGWQEAMIWSCLQDVMGDLFVTSLEHPVSVMAFIGDFCFFAGKPDRELVLHKPKQCKQDFIIMVPGSDAWGEVIEICYQEKAKKMTRYATKKEPDVFDKKMLQSIIETLPNEYSIKTIDEELFTQCQNVSWCRDWVGRYSGYTMYQEYGLGIVILKGNEIVSGASSYISYLGGIEIEIDTKEEYRRKGLAAVCGAKLILECLTRGWYPSWDAQNKWSVALAEKLGYHYDYDYVAYEIWNY